MRQIFYLWLLIIVVAVGLMFLLAALPVQVRIIYEGRGRSHKVKLRLGIFNGRLNLDTKLPLPRRNGKKQPIKLARSSIAGYYRPQLGKNGVNLLVQWRRLGKMIARVRRSLGVLKEFLRRSVCTRLLWETGFGLDDYAATGLTTGLFWAGKGLLIGLLSRYLRINPDGVRVAVVPQFGSMFYESTLDCILETFSGYIMIVVLKLCVIWLLQSPGTLMRRKRYA